MGSSNADTFSRRYEKKFVISEDLAKKIGSDRDGKFVQYFEFDYVKDSLFNIIENIYFDTHFLDSYHESVEKKPVRTKLRIRGYNSNGLPEKNVFFEIKEKAEGQTLKSRIAVSQLKGESHVR